MLVGTCSNCGTPVTDTLLKAGLGSHLGSELLCERCSPPVGSVTICVPSINASSVDPRNRPDALPNGCTHFYFCEKCGKRVTGADLAAGRAHDKQMRGIFCGTCSAGVPTHAFNAIPPAETSSEREKRRPAERRMSCARLPALPTVAHASASALRLIHRVAVTPPVLAMAAIVALTFLVAIGVVPMTSSETTGATKTGALRTGSLTDIRPVPGASREPKAELNPASRSNPPEKPVVDLVHGVKEPVGDVQLLATIPIDRPSTPQGSSEDNAETAPAAPDDPGRDLAVDTTSVAAGASVPLDSAKTVFLSDLPEQEVRVLVARGGRMLFGKNGQMPGGGPFSLAGRASRKGIFLHPTDNGNSHVAYGLDGTYVRFRGDVGIRDGASNRTALTFKIIADGKDVWVSAPCRRSGVKESFDVPVTAVRKLELIVSCPGSDHLAHAVWFEPRLVQGTCESR